MRLVSASRARRTLAAIVFLGICNHAALAGSRMAASLDALQQGAGPATVGLLVALFALVPMLLALPAGRFVDRVGPRKPMLTGSIAVGAGTLLASGLRGLAPLFAAATLVGAGFMLFQVAAQRVTGELGEASDRVGNYARLSLGYSLSGFGGPLLAGIAVDRLGFAATFGALSLATLVPVAVLALDRLALPRARPLRHTEGGGRWTELLRLAALRRILAVNALFSVGWELHTIFVPIYGARIGLTGSAIGAILSSFAAATFVVRFATPWIMRRATEQQVLTSALLLAGLVYLLFPFSHEAATLAMLSFALGLGLGCGQPIVMSLLYASTPDGRMGEAAGLRMALIQGLSVAVPLVFGALGSLGLLPVFWTVGLLLGGGGALVRARPPRTRTASSLPPGA